MSRRFPIGRYAGIPVLVDASWFVMLGVISWTLATGYFPSEAQGLRPQQYWLLGIVAAVLLFVCVLLHELGHALLAKLSGLGVDRIVLFIFGGVAQIAQEARRPVTELAIALAGPLVSVAIGFACRYVALMWHPQTLPDILGWLLLRYLFYVNIGLVLFNLLPGLPLDGGRVVGALLWAMTGDVVKATRIAGWLGGLLGLGLWGLGLWSIVRGEWMQGMWDVLLGTFLRQAAQASAEHAKWHPAA